MQEVACRTTQTSLALRVEVAANLLDLDLAVAALLVLAFALAAGFLLLLGRVDDVLLVGILALAAVGAGASVAHLVGHLCIAAWPTWRQGTCRYRLTHDDRARVLLQGPGLLMRAPGY